MTSGIGSLGIVDPAALPKDIRTGTPERRKAYEAALAFERTLLQQLTASLAKSASPTGDDEQGADAATSSYKQMLPDTLADALVRNGGLGLARQLVPVQEKR